MGLTRKELRPMYQAWANNSVNAYEKAKGRQQDTEENRLTRDAALAQLIKGKEMDHDSKDTMLTRQIGEVERMRGVHGPDVPVNVEGVSIGSQESLLSKLIKQRDLNKPQLTPAQESSEKESGKKLSAWEVSGGSPAMEKNLGNQEKVLGDLKNGKRDWYDKNVGGTLQALPLVGNSLMSIFAPTEKARMDQAQGGAVHNIKAVDSAPTQVLIDQTMTRAYDPRATNEQNAERVGTDLHTGKSTKAQMEQASDNLARTGYVMPGLAGQRAPAPQRQAPTTPKTGLEQLSDAELKAMAAKLGIK